MRKPRGLDHVSESPTIPVPAAGRRGFDVADLYQGPLGDGGGSAGGPVGTVGATDAAAAVRLDEKLRQAYFWIVNQAIISPFYDLEFNEGPPSGYTFGDAKARVTLPTDQSYSSFVLLPLLNLMLRRRCLLVGGPGRGKTASAVLIGVLAGTPLREVKRAIQHGQPQMTIADLLGNPLPSSLVSAGTMDDVKIAWRKWLGLPVKIIDEYNRIPTRTQSALLTVMADDYAEIYDQIYECPPAAWFLTANDDAGGGTYQVIEALRDRIDIVVKAPHFNSRFLGDLLERIEADVKPESVVPGRLVFSAGELDAAHRQILAMPVPEPLLARIGFFAGQFEFCERAADQLEYKTKDTVKLSGLEVREVQALDSGREKLKDLGLQTRNGLSVRSLMTVLAYSKAMAWFRGRDQVDFDSVRQVLPFVFHDKLVQEPDAPFFETPEHRVFRSDKIGWIRRLFDLACAEYDRLDRDRDDPVGHLLAEFARGLDGLDEPTTRRRLVEIERVLDEWSRTRKLYPQQFDDILALKYLHQRYINYLKWLLWKG